MTTLIKDPIFKIPTYPSIDFVLLSSWEKTNYLTLFKNAAYSSQSSFKKGAAVGSLFTIGLVGLTSFKILLLSSVLFATFGGISFGVSRLLFSFFKNMNQEMKKQKERPEALQRINFDHLDQAKEFTKIDMVKGTATLDDLLHFCELKNEIDFQYEKTISKERLRAIISSIQNKTAALGTPKEGSTKLLEFYENIENMLLACIIKLNQEHQELMEKTGYKIPVAGSEFYNEYCMIQEARLNLAYDLSESKKGCGANWISEISLQYSTIVGHAKGLSFQQLIFKALADYRLAVAREYIYAQTRGLGDNAHYYAGYMQALGKEFGLIAGEQVIEYLRPFTEREIAFAKDHFYARYKLQNLVSVLENFFVTSAEHRELLVEWIKQQAGDWNKEKFVNEARQIYQEVKDLYSSQDYEISQERAHLELLKNCIRYARGSLKANDLEDNIEKCFEFPWFESQSKYIHPSPLYAKNTWKVFVQSFVKNHKHLIEILMDPSQHALIENKGKIDKALQQDKKISAVRRLLNQHELGGFDLSREYSEQELKDLLGEASIRKQQNAFLEKIWDDQEKIPSKVVLLWLLHSIGVIKY